MPFVRYNYESNNNKNILTPAGLNFILKNIFTSPSDKIVRDGLRETIKQSKIKTLTGARRYAQKVYDKRDKLIKKYINNEMKRTNSKIKK
jgi:hypothetical protein